MDHSFSHKYFKDKFLREGIEGCYNLFPIKDIDDICALIADNELLKGLNVTIPYKRSVLPYLDKISEHALNIGAVNVVKILKDNKDDHPVLMGYNTDWEGFYRSLKPLLNSRIRSALVLGTGGASAAVSYALERLGIATLFVSRTSRGKAITYEMIGEKEMADNLLIVNTTPLGMYPYTQSSPDIPYDLLTSSHVCYDLVYNPEETQFMIRSRNMGATVKNGLEMLHIQAELSWKIWNGH